MVCLKRGVAKVLFATAVLLSTTVPSDVSAAPHFLPAKYLIILAKVVGVRKTVLDRFTTFYSYRIRVLCEYRHRLKAGSDNTLMGKCAIRRNGSVFIPVMKRRAYFLAAVKPSSNSALLRYPSVDWPRYWLPIGIQLPSPVAKGDLENLKVALLRYGEMWAAGGKLAHVRAIGLARSKNYFLWALGVSTLSKRASPAQVDRWISDLESLPALSPRRAFWLIHCVRRVVPARARPSTKEIFLAVACYLRQLAAPHEPGYKH